jgi:hypothetical protein
MVMFLKRIDMDDSINTSPQVVTEEQRQKYKEIRNELLIKIINLIDPKTAKKTTSPNIKCILENANLIKNIKLILNGNGLMRSQAIKENRFLNQILNKLTVIKKKNEPIAKKIEKIVIVGKNIEALVKTLKEVDDIIENKNSYQSEVFDKLQDRVKNEMVTITSYLNLLIKRNILTKSQNLEDIRKKLNEFLDNNDSAVTDYKERSKEEKEAMWKQYKLMHPNADLTVNPFDQVN